MLSACRGSLAKSSVQQAAALHLLPLSRRWETLPPASPARSQPRPPCPPASLGHKATFSQHLLTVVSLLRAVEESSGLENPGSLILALRAGRGDFEKQSWRGPPAGGAERVAPGVSLQWPLGAAGTGRVSRSQRAPQGLVAEGPCSQGWGGLVLCLRIQEGMWGVAVRGGIPSGGGEGDWRAGWSRECPLGSPRAGGERGLSRGRPLLQPLCGLASGSGLL